MTQTALYGHQITGCPAVFPWLDECIHYSGTGSLQHLAQRAAEHVRAAGEEYAGEILRVLAPYASGQYRSPFSMRSEYIAALEDHRPGKVQVEDAQRAFFTEQFGAQEAEKMIQDLRTRELASTALGFLASHNYDVLSVFTQEGLKAWAPTADTSVAELVEAIHKCLDVWTAGADPSDREQDWFAASNNDITTLLLHAYFGGEILRERYVDRAEGYEEFYYVLDLDGQRIDLFSGLPRPFWSPEDFDLVDTAPILAEEILGVPSVAARYALLTRRTENVLLGQDADTVRS